MHRVLAVAAGILSIALGGPAAAHHVVVAAPDAAGPATATGLTCGLVAGPDVTGEDDVHTGLVEAGPLTPDDPTAEISVRCTVQVGPTGATHAGPDAHSAESMPTPAVTVLVGRVDFRVPVGNDVYLCTQIAIDGVVWYWDAAGKAWSRSDAVACKIAITQDVPPVP